MYTIFNANFCAIYVHVLIIFLRYLICTIAYGMNVWTNLYIVILWVKCLYWYTCLQLPRCPGIMLSSIREILQSSIDVELFDDTSAILLSLKYFYMTFFFFTVIV